MKTKNFIKGALIGTLLAAGAAVVINKKVSAQTKAKTKKVITDLTATILERMRLLRRVTKVNYNKVIEAVLNEYKTSKKLSDQTVKELRRDLKAQWKTHHNYTGCLVRWFIKNVGPVANGEQRGNR